MRQKMLLVLYSIILCTCMIGCSESKAENSDDVENVIEDSAKENVTETNNIILPLSISVDVNNLDNCTVPISLEKGGIYVDDTGTVQMDVTVYTYDLYDMVDIASLKDGDIIVIREQDIKISSLERNERGLLINGGLDNGGYEFRTDDATVWYECGYSDSKSYYELGKATIRVSEDMNFYDGFDLDKGEVIYCLNELLADDTGVLYHFVPGNTSIVIENGMIIEMHRSYMP